MPTITPSRFDIPVLRAGLVPGKGNKVEYQFKAGEPGLFAREEADRQAADLTTTKWVGEVLHSHYRGHFWSVEVSSVQGVCLIGIPVLLGNWKYIIKLRHLTAKTVIEAGGHILERFKIPRSSLDVAAFVGARKHRISRANHNPPV